MGRIGVEAPSSDITPRESGQTSTWSLVTRNLKETRIQEFVEGEQTQMWTADASLREPVEWHGINWKDAHRNVRRLQARIVKAKQSGKAASCDRGVSRGLSRVR
jgi:hypothetical protein